MELDLLPPLCFDGIGDPFRSSFLEGSVLLVLALPWIGDSTETLPTPWETDVKADAWLKQSAFLPMSPGVVDGPVLVPSESARWSSFSFFVIPNSPTRPYWPLNHNHRLSKPAPICLMLRKENRNDSTGLSALPWSQLIVQNVARPSYEVHY